MNLESQPADNTPDIPDDSQARRARRRVSARERAKGKVPITFWILAVLAVVISLPLWLFSNSAHASLTLCACITAVSVWYVAHQAKRYGGLTFSSCFVMVSGFVFVARGVYVSVFNDFSILISLNQPPEHRLITDALTYVLYGTLTFILGALLLERKTLQAQKNSRDQGRITLALASPNLSLIFLGLQVVFVFLLLPYGEAQSRASLAGSTANAYVYLLPTLIHGFNLYIFTYIMSGWTKKKNLLSLLLLLLSSGLMLVHAYCMYNMSNFRSFYLVGLFTAGIIFILARWNQLPVFFLVAMFALYPLFKTMGADRTLSNKQMVQKVILNPGDSYDSEGMERAFGEATDINMLDTLVASLNYEHKFHPYILSDLYVLVHWIPRKVWPGKPAYGVLADLDYTLGLPYSPGLIGFINDDGGKFYLIVMMGFLGAFFKWCERVVLRIRWRELYLAVWAALFLATLLSVRCLPYQAFYGFLVFLVPAWLLNSGVKLVTGQFGGPRRPRKKNRPNADPAAAS